MKRIDFHRLAIAGALFALCGCGAHTPKSQLPADVLRSAITPVVSTAPEGVLSPAGNDSRSAAIVPHGTTPPNVVATKPAPSKPAPTKPAPTKPAPTTAAPTEPAPTSAAPTRAASTRYAADRAVRAKSASSAAAPPETAPGKPASSTATPVTAAPASSPPTSTVPASAKPTRLSSPTGFVIVDQLPEVIVRVPPAYPVPPRDAPVGGSVTIQALVGADGKVYDTRVVRSSPLLDGAAKAAVMQWRFTPALSGGRPVAVWFDVPVTFSPPSRPNAVPAPRPARTVRAPWTSWPDSIPRPRYGETVFVEEKEEALERVPPAYPDSARLANVDGTVLVGALVGIDGNVYDVIAVHSIPMLNEAAFTAVRAWRFKPALAYGKPVPVWTLVPVKFSLH